MIEKPVLSIVPKLPPTAEADVVKLLEEALEQAKAGKLTRAGLYCRNTDNNFDIYFAGLGSYSEDIGVLEQMKHALLTMSVS